MNPVAWLVMFIIALLLCAMTWCFMYGPILAAVMFGALALSGFYILGGVL